METNDFNKNLNQIEEILSDFIQIFPILMGLYSKIKMNEGYKEKKNLELFENLIELSIKSKIILENFAIKKDLRFERLFDLKTIWQGKKREDMLLILEKSMNFYPIAMHYGKILENESKLSEDQSYILLRNIVSIGEDAQIPQKRDYETYNLFGQVQRPDRKTIILNINPENGEKILSLEKADIQEEDGNIYITIPKSIVYEKDEIRPFYENDYNYSIFVLKSKNND
ncbi:hypothetical protein DSAG12_02552 [Promethearchaeum syntrophicum]|uniref:Uncharacterized protein n=1 Tax=Promethearchaeum syntrophicum TaxID=2594042 RepID=A0A5B9DC72_9ARCH|nr:hypothetical protein [Candidatus Prometheoarchaeum syntrophicum]QEE16722.1 hypothetical protein DSAG12_02552 [Candidatus Prometheoarchaeum syntrophicum]